MEIKKIFKKSMAINLIRMGNELINTEPNLKNPKFTVFIFNKTRKLLKDITQLNLELKSNR
ncbi:DUF5659 domain-containing protein [Haloimpatiens massiliensis]|uniref:DUF5659 domain-containing protein n=1 Tax=Haloimpatiens massiliensis TaxID=1658110 RepID=UPI000C8490F2|nr:DUF5659 domain-containing protein [Haloimpatiens massiliensis]